MALETTGDCVGVGEYDGRNLELNLAFDVNGDVLGPPNVGWEALKRAIGHSVAVQVADRVMPQIISQLGADRSGAAAPAVNSRYSLDNDSEIAAAGGFLSMEQHLEGTFHLALQGDGQVDGGDLIAAARDQIAVAIADSAVFALEQRFEGKQTSDTETSVRREGGRIAEYRRTPVPPRPASRRSPQSRKEQPPVASAAERARCHPRRRLAPAVPVRSGASNWHCSARAPCWRGLFAGEPAGGGRGRGSVRGWSMPSSPD